MVTEAFIVALAKVAAEVAIAEMRESAVFGDANEVAEIAARARMERKIAEKARELMKEGEGEN